MPKNSSLRKKIALIFSEPFSQEGSWSPKRIFNDDAYYWSKSFLPKNCCPGDFIDLKPEIDTSLMAYPDKMKWNKKLVMKSNLPVSFSSDNCSMFREKIQIGGVNAKIKSLRYVSKTSNKRLNILSLRHTYFF